VGGMKIRTILVRLKSLNEARRAGLIATAAALERALAHGDRVRGLRRRRSPKPKDPRCA